MGGSCTLCGEAATNNRVVTRLRAGQGLERWEQPAQLQQPRGKHMPWANKAAPAWQHLSQHWQEAARGQEGWQVSKAPLLSSQKCQNPE